MSLLMNYNDPKWIEIAQLVFEEQFKRDPKLNEEMDERRKKLMYDDVVYNISFLMTAVYFNDAQIFEGYAKWIYELLCNVMRDIDRNRIMQQMNDHYRILAEVFNQKASGYLKPEELVLIQDFLNKAIDVTQKAVTEVPLSTNFLEGDFFDIRKAYLDALLTGQTKKAQQVIRQAKEQGISMMQVYEEILTKVMYEIGHLWHSNYITVDREHYATSVTQSVLSSFYDEIFESPRKNKTLLSCAIGSELHELGIRMLSDIFEFQGWDTVYLGAALPIKAILNAIEENKPDLVALSVTMPPYLSICEQIVVEIKKQHPHLRIAVGGQAFRHTNQLWKKWPVDFYVETASELAKWAKKTI